MKSNSASNALISAGFVVFIAGCAVGLRPLMLNDELSCGSAWFPGGCTPGLHNSSMAISMVLLLIGAAAAIAGTVVRSQKPPPPRQPAGKKNPTGKKKTSSKKKNSGSKDLEQQVT